MPATFRSPPPLSSRRHTPLLPSPFHFWLATQLKIGTSPIEISRVWASAPLGESSTKPIAHDPKTRAAEGLCLRWAPQINNGLITRKGGCAFFSEQYGILEKGSFRPRCPRSPRSPFTGDGHTKTIPNPSLKEVHFDPVLLGQTDWVGSFGIRRSPPRAAPPQRAG